MMVRAHKESGVMEVRKSTRLKNKRKDMTSFVDEDKPKRKRGGGGGGSFSMQQLVEVREEGNGSLISNEGGGQSVVEGNGSLISHEAPSVPHQESFNLEEEELTNFEEEKGNDEKEEEVGIILCEKCGTLTSLLDHPKFCSNENNNLNIVEILNNLTPTTPPPPREIRKLGVCELFKVGSKIPEVTPASLKPKSVWGTNFVEKLKFGMKKKGEDDLNNDLNNEEASRHPPPQGRNKSSRFIEEVVAAAFGGIFPRILVTPRK